MSTDRTNLSDRELWQRIAAERPAAPATVSDMEFAAWLEGRLPEEASARIETAVAVDPVLRQAALDLADILGKPLPAPPSRVAIRARALVGFAAERKAPRAAWWTALLPEFGRGFGLQRGAFAGVAVIVAALGFVLGGGLGESYAEGRYASLQSRSSTVAKPFGRDTINELTDLFSDNT